MIELGYHPWKTNVVEEAMSRKSLQMLALMVKNRQKLSYVFTGSKNMEEKHTWLVAIWTQVFL